MYVSNNSKNKYPESAAVKNYAALSGEKYRPSRPGGIRTSIFVFTII